MFFENQDLICVSRAAGLSRKAKPTFGKGLEPMLVADMALAMIAQEPTSRGIELKPLSDFKYRDAEP